MVKLGWSFPVHNPLLTYFDLPMFFKGYIRVNSNEFYAVGCYCSFLAKSVKAGQILCSPKREFILS